jgi:LPXTG-motif cell wall-anchored protein
VLEKPLPKTKAMGFGLGALGGLLLIGLGVMIVRRRRIV